MLTATIAVVLLTVLCGGAFPVTNSSIPSQENRIISTGNSTQPRPYAPTPGRDGRDGIAELPGQARVGEQGPQGERGLQDPPAPPEPTSRGVVYTRWGSSSCPNASGTTLVYAGRTGGNYHYAQGGGANHLCLPPDPEYTLPYRNRTSEDSDVFGTQYQDPIQGTDGAFIPCAVCLVSKRDVALMIPAKTSCPPFWTEEYKGYIMSAGMNTKPSEPRSTFKCVDESQESVPGIRKGLTGARLHHVENSCNGIQCPPYDYQKQLNCVLCTK